MSGKAAAFLDRDCDILGISTDDIETHARWLTTSTLEGGLGPLTFPLAADPQGETCERYGVYVKQQRVALRGLFIIDPNGVLQYQLVHSLSVGRSTEEVIRVLDALQSGGLCPGERAVGSPLLNVREQLQPGRVLGPYSIGEKLGAGSFGTVYRAEDTLLDRAVALKILHEDHGVAPDALLREARAAAALNHPNLCSVHTIDASQGVTMIVMEYVEGRVLDDVLREGALATDRAVALAGQIASGMASAHKAGVIHGDLKPGNIIITAEDTAKVMDFGLARRELSSASDDTLPHSEGSTSSGLTGTVSYLAPERARGGPATKASDTFALALLTAEMLTGKRAIEGTNVLEALHNIEQFDGTHLLELLPPAVRPLLARALRQDPDQRPAMSELAETLQIIR